MTTPPSQNGHTAAQVQRVYLLLTLLTTLAASFIFLGATPGAALAFLMAGLGMHMTQTAGLALAADRATDMVSQILTFSRRQNEDRQPLNLVSVIEDALALLRSSLPSSRPSWRGRPRRRG